MKCYIVKGLIPKELRKKFSDGSVGRSDVKIIIKDIKKDNERKRVLLGATYLLDFWADNTNLTETGRKKAFAVFMRENGYKLNSSYLSKALRACQIEELLGVPYGTHRESVLRPFTPLLTSGNESQIHNIWSCAEKIAESEGKRVNARHVKQAISDDFSELFKTKRGRPPKKKLEDDTSQKTDLNHVKSQGKSALKVALADSGIPIGIQFDISDDMGTLKHALIQDLIIEASKLSVKGLKRVIRRVKKLLLDA